MAKYSFDVSGNQLIVSLVPVLADVQPTSMSYLAPSFKIGVGKINAYEYGQPKQSFLFTEIGEIDGVAPTDLQDAFDKLTALTANFNGGGAAPYKVYTALLTQTGTNAPVATVLENTIPGFSITPKRSFTGLYQLICTPVLDINKVYFDVINTQIFSGFIISKEITVEGIVQISTKNGSTPTDGILSRTPIEIRVYN
ncbi:MAG: hypothetical protein EKK64_11215 [Neisseriaceae bacterium]|nr:MAG: hypothetical protein EKK64_11215 [Neisseriaceae bacterium]